MRISCLTESLATVWASTVALLCSFLFFTVLSIQFAVLTLLIIKLIFPQYYVLQPQV